MAGLLDAIQSALTGGEKAVTGINSGVSAMLSSKQGGDKNSNVIYASFGMAGRAGQQRISGSGTLPAAQAKSTYKAKANNTEKLLTDVVRYLVSINSTLKKQIDFDRRVYEENALAAREAKIEQTDTFQELGKRYGANDNEKPKGGIVDAILKAVRSLAKIGLKGLLEGLKLAIEGFSTAWKWLRGLSFLKNIRSLVGLVEGIVSAPLAIAALAAGLITYGLLKKAPEKIMDDAWKKPADTRDELEKKYGMKPVLNDQGFTEGWVLPDGKTYKNGQLPPKYQDILDAYGPNNRGGTSDAARERSAKNPGAYAPDALSKELKGGEQTSAPAPSATQSATRPGRVSPELLGKTPEQLTDAELRQLVEAQRRIEDPRGVTNNPGGIRYKTGPLQEYQVGYVNATKDKSVRIAKYDTSEHGVQAAMQNWRTSRYAGKPIRDSLDTWSGGEGARYENWLTGQPAQPSSSSGSSDGLLQKAGDAIDGALTNIAEFIGTLGAKIVGPGVARDLTTTGPDFAKLISEESNRIQNEIAMGEKKKQAESASIPPSAQSLKIASPNGSISVVDPNYSGTGGIEKYLAHYKLAQ